jgi:hypothetical protein
VPVTEGEGGGFAFSEDEFLESSCLECLPRPAADQGLNEA